MRWLREAFLGNWRNKGVAMFFACTIWFVAYQSEKQDDFQEFSVILQPRDPESMIITSQTAVLPDGKEEPFNGRIHVQFSGPRKLIGELQNEFALGRRLPPFEVEPETDVVDFSEDKFEFARRGVTITSVSPRRVRITQDKRDEKTIDLEAAGKLTVTNFLEAHRIVSPRIDPAQVRVTGPESILGSVDVRLTFSMELREHNEGEVNVDKVFTDETVPDFVRERVQVFPRTVKVEVTTEARYMTLSLDGVRISFRVRMPGVAFKIVSEDFDPVNGTIPVELYGPQEDIEKIKEVHKNSPLTLSVPVRAIRPDQDSQRTFGEGDLELYGFPKVQVRQHESRRDKGPWTYRISPVVEKGSE